MADTTDWLMTDTKWMHIQFKYIVQYYIQYKTTEIAQITKYITRVIIYSPNNSGETTCNQSVDVQASSEKCRPATGEGPTSSHPPQDNDSVSLSQWTHFI